MSGEAAEACKRAGGAAAGGQAAKRARRGSDGPPAAARIDGARYPSPLSLLGWVEEHRAELRPPVGNKMVYAAAECMWKVMVVGGPNVRSDYHIEAGEEWFLQLKGDLLLKTVDGGRFTDVLVREGECFLLPGGVPHSPQRGPGTVGLVVERRRREGELDGLRWYCPACRAVTHERFFPCHDLGAQLGPLIEAYYASPEAKTCPACGVVDEPPRAGAAPREDHGLEVSLAACGGVSCEDLPRRNRETHPDPFSFQGWIEEHRASLRPPVGARLMLGRGADFKIMVVGGPNRRTDYHTNETEEWFYQLRGNMVLKVVDGDGNFRDVPIREGECFLLPAGVPHSPQRPEAGSVGLVIEHERRASELDSLRWYCAKCRAVVHWEAFHLFDLEKDLGPPIRRYYATEELRTCRACGTVDQPPPPVAAADPE